MKYLDEQNEWDNVVRKFVGSTAELVNVSQFSSDCRVYRSPSAVYKIRRMTPASRRHRLNSLEDEFLVLRHLAAIPGIPRARSYERFHDWEVLKMDPIAPLPRHDPTFGPPREKLRDFWAVLHRTYLINMRGCSHGDLHHNNAGRNVDQSLSFFDFDQALFAHPARCLLRDFVGLSVHGTGVKVSLINRARTVEGIGKVCNLLAAAKSRSGSLLSYLSSANSHRLQRSWLADRVSAHGDWSLDKLARAWEIAGGSNASSPGADVAYYSLDISGINFPGERPWLLRWEQLRKHIDFRGKRFLELGCNLGLLSIHAKIAGASQCVALDADAEILQAAGLAAEAFDCDVQFQQADLDSIDAIDVVPEQFDIVSALSVMHWVRNRKQLWSFLARSSELIYEGHESEEESIHAIRNAGFTEIVRLGLTERNRQMFWARKQGEIRESSPCP